MMSRRSFTGPSRTLMDRPTESNSLATNTWMDSILRRSVNSQSQLEEIINIDNDLEVFSNNQLNTLNPRELYRTGIFTVNTGLYRHHREEILSISDGNQQTINLMSAEAIKQLRIQNYKLIHLGLIVIGVRGLVRQKIGSKLLIVLIDERHQDLDKAIFGTIEVDMNNNIGIVYISPNFSMTLSDFYKHIKIVIQTKGFENFNGKNILLDITFLGKCMTKYTPKIKIKLDEVIKTLTSTGIKFLKPMEIDSSILAGHEWTIQNPNENRSTLQPNDVVTYTNPNGAISLRFKDYGPSKQSEIDTDDESTSELQRSL